MKVEPYLFFGGRCEEAIEFYRKTLGAETTMLMRFKDAPPDSKCSPGHENKIMHANIRIGETAVMMSDGQCEGKTNFQGFALTIGTKTPDDAAKMFKALGDGGNVIQPLTKTFFSPSFGMLTDKFGMMWMIMTQM